MMKRALIAACVVSTLALAGGDKGGKRDGEDRQERREEMGRKARMLAVVGIADALELSEADALKLPEKLRVIEEKRKPIRDGMGESMRSLKAAADGDAAALARVDAEVARLLDGRSQLAAIDKEMFAQLSAGQTPEKKARLALFLAKFGEQMRHGGKGRHKQPRLTP